jgi:hypothetical protein
MLTAYDVLILFLLQIDIGAKIMSLAVVFEHKEKKHKKNQGCGWSCENKGNLLQDMRIKKWQLFRDAKSKVGYKMV